MLPWSSVDRDSNEFKLLKPYLRRGDGKGYGQPSGRKTGVPVARPTKGTPIKSGRDPGSSGNYVELKGRCVLSVPCRNHTSGTDDRRIKRG